MLENELLAFFAFVPSGSINPTGLLLQYANIFVPTTPVREISVEPFVNEDECERIFCEAVSAVSSYVYPYCP